MITQSLSKGKFILSLGKLDFLAFGNYCGPTAVPFHTHQHLRLRALQGSRVNLTTQWCCRLKSLRFFELANCLSTLFSNVQPFFTKKRRTHTLDFCATVQLLAKTSPSGLTLHSLCPSICFLTQISHWLPIFCIEEVHCDVSVLLTFIIILTVIGANIVAINIITKTTSTINQYHPRLKEQQRC